MDGDLKIFISWSGGLAKGVGAVLHAWLPSMFDQILPFMSDVDISAGSRGLVQIEEALAGTRFGIVVTTRSNQHAPWLNFEAGALSKAVGNDPAFVAPFLVDFEREADITGPLQQFQANLNSEQGVRRIVSSIAKLLGVPEKAWEPRFDALWPNLQTRLYETAHTLSTTPEPKTRSSDDLLAEVLELVRSLVRTADSPSIPQKARTLADDLDTFLNSIDWDMRSRMMSTTGDKITSLRVGLAEPVDPGIIEAARQAILVRFDVEADISATPLPPLGELD